MDDNGVIKFNTPSTSDDDGNKKRCSECMMSFTSIKALFVHMRGHPGRDWRGTRPPSWSSSSSNVTTTTASINKYYSSISSSGSENTSSSTPPSIAFNMPNWAVTAKRGRMSLLDVKEDEQLTPNSNSTSVYQESPIMLLEEAAPSIAFNMHNWAVNAKRGRMSLVDVKEDEQLTPNSNSTSVYQESTIMLLEEAAEKLSKWKELEENTEVANTNNKKQKIDHESGERCEDDGHISDSTMKKKVKFIDEVGVFNSVSGSRFFKKQLYKYVNKQEQETKHTGKPRENAALRAINIIVDHKLKTLTPDGEFKCDICGRCFSCYQALGGHKSSHGNRHSSFGTDPKLQLGQIVINTHQCKICEKSFPTGQAIGGHMRLHRVARALHAHSRLESELNSDLSQLAPDMEEELRRNQLTLSLF